MEKSTKKHIILNCEKCSFSCIRKPDWVRHLATSKHKKLIFVNAELMEKAPKIYNCHICKKEYRSSVGLWKHNKKCIAIPELLILNDNTEESKHEVIEILIKENADFKNIILDMVKNSSELQKNMLEICKNSHTINNNNTTYTNSHNKTFNLQVFLNEQCKDAINFSDFIKNIEVSHEDLENNARLGFVSGISKIFLDNLKQLGVNERPFHCTDMKRETMYIKDEDKWTKESDDSKLQKAIQTVSYKSIGKLQEWKKENPEYQDINSEFSEKCLDIHKHTIAGSDRDVYYPKVIHVLAKETMVDK